jgi:hypothetical protein
MKGAKRVYYPRLHAMPLTLLVPDLLPLALAPEAAGLRLPALESWLARAQARREPGTGSRWLAAQWGLGEDAPVAALTLAADGGPREGEWLRADPVHQRVEGNGLVLHDASALALTREECDAALAELNRFFAADGLRFIAPAPERWYVRVPAGELPRTVPLEAVVGRNPFGMLPEGRGRLRWPSLFSEAQMLLAGLAFNRAREAAGRPALNAVWFWGGGAYPAALPRPFAGVAADAPLPRALALASGCAVQSLPAGLAQMPSPGTAETLAVVDPLTRPRRQGDRDAWLAAAQALDRDWFVPLGRALGTFGRVRIVLPGERDTAVFELAARARWRFFRRPKPIHTHA